MIPAKLPGSSSVATLSDARNQVTVQEHPGSVNEALYRANHVSTGDDSGAEVTFHDTTQLNLMSDTLVIILGSTNSSANVSHAQPTTLVTGTLRSHLAALAGKGGEPIDTAAATVTLGGGEAQVSVDDRKATRLAVYQGKSTLSAQHQKVAVKEGFGSKAERGRVPTPPKPLPPAPQWASPTFAPQLVLGKAAELSAAYHAGTGSGPAAATWHIQVARDVGFRKIVVDTKVPVSVTNVEAKNLGGEVYYLRVSAIDSDAFEGPYSAVLTAALFTADASAPDRNHQRSISFAPAGLSCSIDKNAAAPVTAPVLVSSTQPHTIQCALSTPQLSASATLDAIPLRLAITRARFVRGTTRGYGTLSFLLVDDEGQPVPGMALHPISTPQLELGAPIEGPQPGVYLLPARVHDENGAFQVALQVDGQTLQTPSIDPGPVPTKETVILVGEHERKVRFELSAFGVLGAVNFPHATPGGGGGLGLGLVIPMGPLDGAIDLRGAFEHYHPTQGSAVGSWDLAVLELPLRLSLAEPEHLISPYLALTPQVAWVHSSAQAGSGFKPVGGGGASLGLEWRSPLGAFWLEAGGRAMGSSSVLGSGMLLSGPMGELGYSIRF